MADRIAIFNEGRIVQVGTPMEVYDRPATQFVGSFIGSPPMNFLRGRIDGANGHSTVDLGDQEFTVPVSVGRTSGEVLIGIRAENIEAEAEPAAGAIAARTEVVEPLGSHLLLTAVVGDQRLKIQARTDFPAQPDGPVWLRPEPDKLRWYDPESGQELTAE